MVQTLTFQTLYVFFLISHHRRRRLHFDVPACPTAAWVWRQMIEATPWGQQPGYLIHDRRLLQLPAAELVDATGQGCTISYQSFTMFANTLVPTSVSSFSPPGRASRHRPEEGNISRGSVDP